MDIVFKSINVVDYKNGKVLYKNVPSSFDEYVIELIDYIKENERIRDFKTQSNQKEVISCVLSIISEKNNENFDEKTKLIANRLLNEEKEVQNQIAQMNINVKKGSLIQALLQDSDNDIYYYLLAKVEHKDFVDDDDFTFKTGFYKDKKNIWKSCLFTINNIDDEIHYAKIYSDTEARYWSKRFLELEEINSDEKNTKKAFDFIDKFLNRNVKNKSIVDYFQLRNSTIVYFRTHPYFDYYSMYDEIFQCYKPYEIDSKEYNESIQKLKDIPEDKKFDIQFAPVLSTIKAKIKKVYKVADNIEIVLKDGVENIKNIISSVQESDGSKYIKIKTNDQETFDSFK